MFSCVSLATYHKHHCRARQVKAAAERVDMHGLVRLQPSYRRRKHGTRCASQRPHRIRIEEPGYVHVYRRCATPFFDARLHDLCERVVAARAPPRRQPIEERRRKRLVPFCLLHRRLRRRCRAAGQRMPPLGPCDAPRHQHDREIGVTWRRPKKMARPHFPQRCGPLCCLPRYFSLRLCTRRMCWT